MQHTFYFRLHQIYFQLTKISLKYILSVSAYMYWRNWWNDWQGKPKYSEKTCPNAALSTANHTCCPDANPGHRGGKLATNRLSHGTTQGYLQATRFDGTYYTALHT
jgi:hypothetical protein